MWSGDYIVAAKLGDNRDMLRALLPMPLLCLLLAESPETAATQRKIDQLENDRVPPNSKVYFSQREIDTYVTDLMRKETGDGVRNPKLRLGTNRATGTAVVNFVKLQTDKGQPPGFFIGLLLRGEHELGVSVHGRSGGGQAQVDVDEVTIDGLVIRGKTLDLLIDYYLTPRVPDVKIGKPFQLKHGVDRFETTPDGITLFTGPAKPAAAAK